MLIHIGSTRALLPERIMAEALARPGIEHMTIATRSALNHARLLVFRG